jgi:WD40 repeat protein/serine/threonine protein kinase
MAGRADADAPRDLLLGLSALEAGLIDRDQLLAAVRVWAQSASGSGTLSQALAGLGLIDPDALAALEERARRELEAPDPSAEPTLTVAWTGRRDGRGAQPPARPPGGMAGAGAGGARFRVMRPLARGGLGEIFLALDEELDRTVALKELQTGRAHDPDAQDRFLLEAAVTGRLEHPGIVPVYSLGRYADGRPYYAMRLVEGETLRDAIERFHRGRSAARRDDERSLDFRRLLRSVIDVCNTVAYAHSRGVVHRDLKPDNIMLGPFGETLVVDWGLAKPSGEASEPRSSGPPSGDPSMTQPGSVIGTPRYMSPEQAAGELDRVGPASDIYSLGAILYCLLVGQAPYPDGDLPSVLDRVRRGIFPAPCRLRRTVDPTLEAICLKAMAQDPRARHASALELAGDLEAWQADVRYRDEQEQALNQVKGSLTRLCLERAHNGFARQAHDEGMLWLARALENAPPEPPALPRLIRTSLGAWYAGENLQERRLRLADAVNRVAFGPGGRTLATACQDGTARLWDLSTGSPLSRPLRHEGAVRALAFHPDGSCVVTAGDDGTIRRWDAISGQPLGEPLVHNGPVTVMELSPDGSRIAAGGPGGFRLWDTATGRPVGDTGPDAATLAIAFSPDGAAIALACDDRGVRLRDAATGSPLGAPLVHAQPAPVLAFDPAGRRLLTGCLDGNARLWDLDRATISMNLPHQGEVCCVGFRPAGGAFATSCADGAARLWDSATGHPIGEPLTQRERVLCLAFRPDGTILATGSRDGTARLWCAETGLPIGPPLGQGGAIRALGFSPDGRRLAVGDHDGTVDCWRVPAPVEGDPERIACWVKVTTELEFDAGDAIRRMDGATSWALRRRLADLGGAPCR